MLPPQISEIRLIAIELATVPEAQKRAEKILQLIEEACMDEARIRSLILRYMDETNEMLMRSAAEEKRIIAGIGSPGG